ncbi:hypothetical protein V6N11_072767 [Hibiscus sabdariffa]|uniref:Uncharacterized protein n=1 Tax=Hibiscus sabdariffa TaxID=183260 RepID=A0ABR2NEJ0_9ROSI
MLATHINFKVTELYMLRYIAKISSYVGEETSVLDRDLSPNLISIRLPHRLKPLPCLISVTAAPWCAPPPSPELPLPLPRNLPSGLHSRHRVVVHAKEQFEGLVRTLFESLLFFVGFGHFPVSFRCAGGLVVSSDLRRSKPLYLFIVSTPVECSSELRLSSSFCFGLGKLDKDFYPDFN